MTAQSTTTNGPAKLEVAKTIARIPLDQIQADYKWNARNSAQLLVTGDLGLPEDQNKGVDGLSLAIETEGQKTPVKVRHNPKANLSGQKPYLLVFGFKRFEAIRRLAERATVAKVAHPIAGDQSWSTAHPTIEAEVVTLTDYQARMENIVENSNRDDLSGPDLAYGIADLARLNDLGKGPKMTDATIGQMIGKTQSYVQKLRTIMEKVTPAILENWREAKQQVPYTQMYKLAQEVTVDRQEEEYTKLCGSSGRVQPRKDPNAWLESAKTKARDVGFILGTLERDEHMNGAEIVWNDAARLLAKFKKTASAAEVRAIAGAAKKGYKAGLKAEVVSEEEEEDGDADDAKKETAKKN